MSPARRTLALAIALLAAATGGCGRKGPLYLPEEPDTVITRPGPALPPEPAEPTADEAEPDEEAERSR